MAGLAELRAILRKDFDLAESGEPQKEAEGEGKKKSSIPNKPVSVD